MYYHFLIVILNTTQNGGELPQFLEQTGLVELVLNGCGPTSSAMAVSQ